MHGRREGLQQLGCGYDIREIPEELYLEVLAGRRAETACGAMGLGR
jgi:hypothetical protein